MAHRESWQKLKETGQALLAKFVAEELPRIGEGERLRRKAFELGITGLDAPFVGVIDLVAELDGKRDRGRTSRPPAQAMRTTRLQLSDQLTAYQLAEPDAEQMALCVLVKTKEPKIEWHMSERNPDDLMDYLAKAGYVAREIDARALLQAARHVVLVVRLPAGVSARQTKR